MEDRQGLALQPTLVKRRIIDPTLAFGFWLLDVCYYGSIETALATSCATISPSNSTHRRRLAAAIQGAGYHITSGFESLFYAFSYVSEEPLS